MKEVKYEGIYTAIIRLEITSTIQSLFYVFFSVSMIH